MKLEKLNYYQSFIKRGGGRLVFKGGVMKRKSFFPYLFLTLSLILRVTLVAQNAEKLIQKAQQLYKQKKYTECIQACNLALAQNSSFAEAYRYRALEMEDFDQALRDFNRVLQIDPFIIVCVN